jgi:hypothetical protein
MAADDKTTGSVTRVPSVYAAVKLAKFVCRRSWKVCEAVLDVRPDTGVDEKVC